jgi:cell wall-associated NlpC family hydrolase
MHPAINKGIQFFSRHVRGGFLLAVLTAASVVGSTLWATISIMPRFQVHEPVLPSTSLPMISARQGVPSELAWFFVQFPYVSADAKYRSKNKHTFVVNDETRHREYVILVGQNFRRVEIYYGEDKGRTTVHIFRPGKRRIVEMGMMTGVVSDQTEPHANLWMWQSPLWNTNHLRIYSLADFWLNAPYKKFSCAGFVHQYLKDAGVAVPKLDAWDMAKLPWTRVSLEELEPGDIITIRAASEQHRRFWKQRITHVGVYLGNGKIIHASTTSVRARRSYIRVATLDQFRGRIDKVLRPPQLL